MLATGYVKLSDNIGNTIFVRALFDTGAETNLISEQCLKRANFKCERFTIHLSGITGSKLIDSGSVRASLSPWFDSSDDNTLHRNFVLMKDMPLFRKTDFSSKIPEFERLRKADPYFNKSGAIDLLLGIDVWADIIKSEVIDSQTGLRAQNTKFGFAIFGTIEESSCSTIRILKASANIQSEAMDNLDKQIQRFWEMEDIDSSSSMTSEEKRAEEIFQSTVARNNDGRYVVRIPLIEKNTQLGDSKTIALNRFFQLERRLLRNKDLRAKYNEFMADYLTLGHMRKATQAEHQSEGYYIPHHPVIERFRVVFDASCTTTNGKSVNDIQLAGANLQDKLADVVMRFRFHKYVISADIKKMFRQINIHAEDLKYQRIFWRFNENEPVNEYVLLTVTYGMKSSPFLAIRTMLKLASDYNSKYPLAAHATRAERYMDDYMSGADTEEQTIVLLDQLENMLSEARMSLSKFKTNSPSVLVRLQQEDDDECKSLYVSEEYTTILGLNWQPSSDSFGFKIDDHWSENKAVTKRTIVSAVAKIYDPIGYLAPIVITAKSFIQQLWIDQLKWDDPISDEITERWCEYYNSLSAINELKIPRWIHTTVGSEIELHGFADASELGFGAAIYVRSAMNGNIQCNLLTAKTRVAPVKTISIPRLELCAAKLLAELMNHVRNTCALDYAPYYLYSDSTTTLYWIKSNISNLKIFVANRVSTIQTHTNIETWSYVPSKQNPADIASRGMKSSELIHSNLWWTGPEFLLLPIEERQRITPELTAEKSQIVRSEYRSTLIAVTSASAAKPLNIDGVSLIDKYDSLGKVVRVTAYLFKALYQKKSTNTIVIGRLNHQQLLCALNYWIKYTQQKYFAAEYYALSQGKSVETSNQLKTFMPFLDADSIMRNKGRATNADITYDERYPIIIPAHSVLSKLLIREAHERTLHGNAQVMIHYLRAKYWIIGLRKAVKTAVKSCIICIRYKGTEAKQLMGDLPKERLSNVRPFHYCGVDYFGPIKVKRWEEKCMKIDFGYVAVFVCMTTKMIHLECVSNLKTEKFLWALSRLSSIYQTPRKMFSDNAKTFQGANNELKSIFNSWQSSEVENYLTIQGIEWKFITPRAPFQGGLWEAAVKSTKYHARRILHERVFTFEAYQTLFGKISAVLNSRPIVPMSDDPTELNYLTPSHAVIGGRVIQPLARDMSDITMNRLKHNAQLEKIVQDFWNTWRKEYIGTLQNRYKWNQSEQNLCVDDFVLMKEDNVPPGMWPMARIIKVYPGKDGLVRTVKIRTPHTDLLRPVQKLVRLPIRNEDQEVANQ